MYKGVKKIVGIGLLGTALKLGGAYLFSEKIGYVKHDICGCLSDSLGKKEILCDEETNDIINLMSGKISQQDFDSLLSRYGYKDENIHISKLTRGNEALYKTILEVQTQYTNPKISFSGSFYNIETGENEPKRPRHNMFTNTIQLHQLDASLLQFKNTNQEDQYRAERMMGLKSFAHETWQRYLLNNLITEEVHMRQVKERGAIAEGFDLLWDYMCSGFDASKMYNKKGTVEREAHSVYQLEMIKYIIETYKKYCDFSNPEEVLLLAKFYRGFFTIYQDGYLVPYQDEKQAVQYLNMIEQSDNKFSSYFVGRYYQEIYERECDTLPKHDPSTDTLVVNINGEEMTHAAVFDKCILEYERSYKQGNIGAGIDILYLIDTYRGEEYDNILLSLANNLLKLHKDELETPTLVKIYKIVGATYHRKGKAIKSKKYYDMAEKLEHKGK